MDDEVLIHDPATIGPDDILVLRAIGLGDALTSVAALRGIRHGWPHQRIVLAAPASTGQWLASKGLVDRVLPTTGLDPLPQLPGGHLAINLHGRGPQSHRVLAAGNPRELIAFGCPASGHEGIEWRPEEHEVHRWCRLVNENGGSCGPRDLRLRLPADPGPAAVVVLHPGAAAAARRWPASRWRELARRLSDEGRRVVVTGSAAEAELADSVARGLPGVTSVAGRTSLPELADLVRDAAVVVSADTGIAHLATAYGVRSVVLYGPVSPSLWGPIIDLDRHTVLWHGTEDSPPGDPHGTECDPLLARLDVEEVAAAVTAQLLMGEAHVVPPPGDVA
ncbi:glycosyltransferase family 9 protein [Cumulibacter manganitolerans]|uniref:glycosyltransferase family 9 protein n=1 Tax=Cumulibacter manganitolerans TaxID=1884992 RepID=UPI001297C3CA|nr:glycosyltransferase family 9 protein [Cumulibacter manganitolerans]